MDKNIMSVAQAQEYLGKVTEYLEAIMPDGGCLSTYQDRQHRKVWSEGVTIDDSDDHECPSGMFTYTICYYVDVCNESQARIDYKFNRCHNETSGRFYGSPKEAAEFLYHAALTDGGRYNIDN